MHVIRSTNVVEKHSMIRIPKKSNYIIHWKGVQSQVDIILFLKIRFSLQTCRASLILCNYHNVDSSLDENYGIFPFKKKTRVMEIF